MARLQEKYNKEVLPELQKEFGIKNVNAAPKLEKVCLNMGFGYALGDQKVIDVARHDLATVCGQAPAVTTAKVSVSNFKLREGMRVGCRATLRGTKMYEFIDRLFNVAIPRIRDFRGIKDTSFDKQGNFSMGVEELIIFPEIDTDKIDETMGMDVTFVIKNSSGPDQSRQLLKLLGMPFVNAEEKE